MQNEEIKDQEITEELISEAPEVRTIGYMEVTGNEIPIEPLVYTEEDFIKITEQVSELSRMYEDRVKQNEDLRQKNLELNHSVRLQQETINTLSAAIIQDGITLYCNDKDGNEIELKTQAARASGKVRSELNKASMEYLNAIDAVEKKYREIAGGDQFADTMILLKYKSEIDEIKIKHMPELVKTIINDKQLSTDQKELVRSNANSDFWLMQETAELEKIFLSFRIHNQN